MVNENFYSSKMLRKTVAELQKYIENKSDYQEDAVLAAIWELEKRNEFKPEMQTLKQELEAQNTEAINQPETVKNESVALYSFNFIILFGVLFSVFAGSILIGLNLGQLKNNPRARLATLSGLSYSFLQVYAIDYFKVTSPFISVFSSLFGIYLLFHYFLKPEIKPEENYIARSSWQPLLIALAIALPIAFFLIKSGGATAL